MSRTLLHFLFLTFVSVLITGCSTQILKVNNSSELLRNEEFEESISIREIPPATETEPAESAQSAGATDPNEIKTAEVDPKEGSTPKTTSMTSADGKSNRKESPTGKETSPTVLSKKSQGVEGAGKNQGDKPKKSGPISTIGRLKQKVGGNSVQKVSGVLPDEPTASDDLLREPPLEDSEGFNGRRPLVDPYRVGEKVTFEVSYFGVAAGDMTLEVRPFIEVNGRKCYRFVATAKSTSVFALFYAVDDWAETYVDYETLVPYSYSLHVKESKQLRESRSLFNWSTLKASFWDKKINSEGKVEEKKQVWDIPRYSQNVFSAPFYLRNFQLIPGKSLGFHVAHENENLVVTVEVLRRERLSTQAGEFNTVVVKPKIQLNGVFKPVGDIFLWLTDDQRKSVIRIESKIKIGTIVAEARHISF